MFRNPVYDFMIVVPALLVIGGIGFFLLANSAHAQELDVVPTGAVTPGTPAGSPAVIASTSGNTLPDSTQKILVVNRTPDNSKASSESTTTALSVQTSKDLLVYARSALASDPYIESLTLSGHSVVVTYHKQGRLIGLLPLAVPTTATVHTDGTVQFVEPWYGTITLMQVDHMKSALEVRMHALLTSEGYLPSMSLAPATQAEIVEIIRELVA